MASTLAEIKSRMLVPNEHEDDDDPDDCDYGSEDGEGEDDGEW